MIRKVKDIEIKEFDYPLPDERIAKFPLQQRDACKLICSGRDGGISHHVFSDLPGLVEPGTLMVANETKVINARMEFRKPTGSRIEIFILEPHDPEDYALSFAANGRCSWVCLVGNAKRWKEGALTKPLRIDGREVILSARVIGENPEGSRIVEFSWDAPDVSFAQIVEGAGNIPIPPYLNRDSQESDSSDYQTVFSRVQGSVAAPTAGLHFTPGLLAALDARGVRRETLVLHVGAGTFRPVKADAIGDHPMHTETFAVTRRLVAAIADALREGRPVMAVGTTSVRTLESLPYLGRHIAAGRADMHVSQWEAYDEGDFDTAEALQAIIGYMDREQTDSLTASTAIMIAPGFRWRIVSRMVTNFHQPQSTLLLLVSSFLNPGGADNPQWRRIYREALDSGYRFLSYGDACLLSPVGG